MEKLITESEVIAFDYLKAFGFSDEQVASLIAQGKKDLEKELSKLEILIDSDDLSYDDINDVLHALKGLLFQLGNHNLAEQLNEIRSDLQSKNALEEIRSLLSLSEY